MAATKGGIREEVQRSGGEDDVGMKGLMAVKRRWESIEK